LSLCENDEARISPGLVCLIPPCVDAGCADRFHARPTL